MSGFIGRISENNVKSHILKALKVLQFKDDDSTGVLLCGSKKCEIYKTVGQLKDLLPLIPAEEDGCIGIGHTRWSTYTRQTLDNVYPIHSQNKLLSLVVHGLVDNILSIKRKLVKKGYDFKSKSAVEVVANLVEDSIKEGTSYLEALNHAVNLLAGSYAIVAVFKDAHERLFFAKNASPLIIGKNDQAMAITTDFAAIAGDAHSYYYPQDGEIGYMTKSELFVFDKHLKPQTVSFSETSATEESLELGDYPHYMLKEIEEAPRVIRRLINQYFDGSKYRFDDRLIERINQADNIVFIAAGTSYNSALVGQRYLRNFNKKVDVFIASEWIYYPYQSGINPLYILISQSGETSDIIKCLKVIETYGGDVLAITNTEVSTLYRRADYRLLLHAGTEISVASTKAYIAQITLLSLLYARLVNKVTTIAALELVITAIETIISRRDDIKEIAKDIAGSNDVFFLGRGFDYDLAIEAQLKLKETSYIHSEAYAGGEILHGPIALIEKETPVVVFVSDDTTVIAMREVIEEIKKRTNKVIICSAAPFNLPTDRFSIEKPVRGYHSPIVFAVFAQYLAYFTAVSLNRDVDRPRNLAKAVKDRDVQ